MAALSSSEKSRAWAGHLLGLLRRHDSARDDDSAALDSAPAPDESAYRNSAPRGSASAPDESGRAESALLPAPEAGLVGGPALLLLEGCTLAGDLLQGELDWLRSQPRHVGSWTWGEGFCGAAASSLRSCSMGACVEGSMLAGLLLPTTLHAGLEHGRRREAALHVDLGHRQRADAAHGPCSSALVCTAAPDCHRPS